MKSQSSHTFLYAQNKPPRGPRAIYIDITSICNIQCNYCFHKSPLIKSKRSGKPLNVGFQDIQRIVNDARPWNIERMVIPGKGEPTAHPEFRKILGFLLRQPFSISILTNATFPAGLRPLMAKVDDIRVTLSAPDEDLYQRVQSPRKGLFRTVVSNITELNRLRKDVGKSPVHLTYVINASNYRAIPGIFSLAEKVGSTMIFFRLMQPTPFTRRLCLSRSQRIELLKLILKISGSRLSITHDLNKIKHMLIGPVKIARQRKQCSTGWQNLFINTNGDVGICCHNDNLTIGHLREGSLRDMWEGETARKLRWECLFDFDVRRFPFKGNCEWCQ